ncbi:hypothetical protein DMA11_06565 [Marinilabiliaceae bacterium JC017]|nr:hypothetical protein DMA11_06565 [Marinilabiliaceae bacterium JC017]
MKENLLKTKKALNGSKKHFTTNYDYPITRTSNPEKQKRKYYNIISEFIVDWQIPQPNEEVK